MAPRLAAAAALAIVLAAGPALASAAVHLELSARMSWFNPSLKTTYEHLHGAGLSYLPPTGTGSQTLSFEAGNVRNMSYAAALFLTENVAVQFLTGSFVSDLSGTSTPYHIYFPYTTLMPPSYTPVNLIYDRTLTWPDVTGSFTDRVYCLNGLLRLGRRSGLALDLSGGLAFFRVESEIASVGYTKAWLGGHGVLFLDVYPVKLVVQPVSQTGWNAGAELNFFVTRNAAVSVEARYFSASPFLPEFSFEVIDDGSWVTEVDIAAAPITKGTLELDPSFFKLSAGVKIAF
jgi:hypothetical protein